MRRALPLLIAAALVAVPAFAAEHAVTTVGFEWSPSTVNIAVGDTVNFSSTGNHDLHFQDGAPGHPEDGAWQFSRTFTQAGPVKFKCEVHSTSYDDGMVGVVNVGTASPSPTPGATASPGTTPVPGTTPTPGVTPTPTPTVIADPPAPRFTRARAVGIRRGIRVALALESPGSATGVLRRNGRFFGSLRFPGLSRSVKHFRVRRTREGRRLRPGRYRLRLESAPGFVPDRRTLRVRVP